MNNPIPQFEFDIKDSLEELGSMLLYQRQLRKKILELAEEVNKWHDEAIGLGSKLDTKEGD